MKSFKEIPDLWHQSKAPILILGESGIGKSHLARELHLQAYGEKRKFLTVPLAALNENLVESELFGHCRGAFTGAVSNRTGYCEIVGDGTLFLDEIGELSPENQKKLLYFLEERKFSPVGTSIEKHFNGRIIAATNKNLAKLVTEGKFRQDLYFRLQIFISELRPLRKNPERLYSLLQYYWQYWQKTYQRNDLKISNTCWNFLREHPWYGNIREVKNCMEYLSLGQGPIIEIQDLPGWLLEKFRNFEDQVCSKKFTEQPSTYQEALEKFERELICEALSFYHGRINETSRKLEISKTTLIAKARKYGINVWQIKANFLPTKISSLASA
jgi:transcriptional regulator with PAS, ATPase and Fis domain